MNTLSGGCLCGSVRYTAPAPVLTLICHCSHCQRQSGAPFSVNVIVPSEAVTVQGELRRYQDKGDTGADVQRCFCPNCGSSIMTIVDTHPELLIIKAGTLDERAAATPAAEIYCDRAFSWLGKLANKRFPLGATAVELFS